MTMKKGFIILVKLSKVRFLSMRMGNSKLEFILTYFSIGQIQFTVTTAMKIRGNQKNFSIFLSTMLSSPACKQKNTKHLQVQFIRDENHLLLTSQCVVDISPA